MVPPGNLGGIAEEGLVPLLREELPAQCGVAGQIFLFARLVGQAQTANVTEGGGQTDEGGVLLREGAVWVLFHIEPSQSARQLP